MILGLVCAIGMHLGASEHRLATNPTMWLSITYGKVPEKMMKMKDGQKLSKMHKIIVFFSGG